MVQWCHYIIIAQVVTWRTVVTEAATTDGAPGLCGRCCGALRGLWLEHDNQAYRLGDAWSVV